MRRASFVALVTVAAFATVGCDGNPFAGEPDPSPTTATAPVASPDPDASPGAEFPDPTVEGRPVPNLPPDLISSTDPNQRVQAIQRNRPDPFALVPTTPRVEITVEPSPPAPAVATLPPPPPPQTNGGTTVPRPSGAGGGAAGGSGSGRSGSGASGGLAPIPNLTGGGTNRPATPPPPQPDLARAVKVTGVVQVGTVPYAIVSAPNEPTSRYVRVGQRLSNGEVLVKRIETRPGVDPVVVLEQFGIEVVRAVGEGGAPAESSEQATIAQPQTRG